MPLGKTGASRICFIYPDSPLKTMKQEHNTLQQHLICFEQYFCTVSDEVKQTERALWRKSVLRL